MRLHPNKCSLISMGNKINLTTYILYININIVYIFIYAVWRDWGKKVTHIHTHTYTHIHQIYHINGFTKAIIKTRGKEKEELIFPKLLMTSRFTNSVVLYIYIYVYIFSTNDEWLRMMFVIVRKMIAMIITKAITITILKDTN